MRDIQREDIFKHGVSAATSEFCEWVQFGIYVYVTHLYGFQLLGLLPYFIEIVFFLCTKRINKSFESEVKFRQVSNRCKRVLEVVKLAYANKTKESITSQKIGSRDFW